MVRAHVAARFCPRPFAALCCREKKDILYVAVERELEKHGIVNEKYRKKRKGDIGDVDHEEL